MIPLRVKKPRLCFSKKMLIADYLILVQMVAVFMYFTYTGKDTSNCAIVIGAWIAQLAVSSGFYYWKAKNENLHKYKDAEDYETFQKRLLEELKKLGEDNG